jgi:hypothetical protein
MTQQIINVGTTGNDGTGEGLREAFTAVNDNFTEVYTAGPVGSNVEIANNTISINGTNGNLILQGNGIGNVVTNSSVRPSTDAVFDLGNPSYRYDTVYAGFFVGDGSLLSNVGGGGNGTAIVNGTSNVQVYNNGNVAVGINNNANVVVISPSRMSVNGNIVGANININGLLSAGGNITGANLQATGNIFIGNTVFTRTLTVGTRTTPVTVPLASNNSFLVGTRSSGNVTIYTT